MWIDSKLDIQFYYDPPEISEFSDLYGENIKPTTSVKGGECEAIRILDHHINRSHMWIFKFCKSKTNPCALQPNTTGLSPYITFGCISVRTVLWRIQDVFDDKMLLPSSLEESIHG